MIIPESSLTNTPIVRSHTSARFSGRDAGRAPARGSLFDSPKDEVFLRSLLYQVVAFDGVGLVHLCGDHGRLPVRGPAGGPARLVAALPEAEREALAPLVHHALEV